jgi:uncharacterized protein (DUF1501 family)
MFFINTISRRSFLERALKTGAGLAGLAALTNVPPFVKRALAEGNIGLQGKKVLFIWLRFGNDSLNTIVPAGDPAYFDATVRPDIGIRKDPAALYGTASGLADVPTVTAAQNVFTYPYAIRLGNGFAALHPSLRFLSPVYNAGDLAIVHRVGYPKQSRSHFDSQNYWENGSPNNNLSKDGIFYRTIVESGLANTSPITGVTIQTSLPLIMRGSAAAMTNLTDPLRYDLLGVPNNATTGDIKATNMLLQAQSYQKVDKDYREFLQLSYQNLNDTLKLFASIDFNEGTTPTTGNPFPSTTAGNHFTDSVNLDGESQPYYLFPTINQKNGGFLYHSNDTGKYVVPTASYSFFRNLKAAALILNRTDAFIAGTEFGGFDTHSLQVTITRDGNQNNTAGHLGAHANLMRQLGWSIYALQRYFKLYGKGGSKADANAKVSWDDVVIVTLSEFGRTSIENTDNGTDHAEAGMMMVAGGGVQGYGKSGKTTGVYGCSTADTVPWLPGLRTTSQTTCGTMWAASPTTTAGYLKRSHDYRSVLGEIIRKHLGATDAQLNRIIPGYAAESTQHLRSGGVVMPPYDALSLGTAISGEPNILL